MEPDGHTADGRGFIRTPSGLTMVDEQKAQAEPPGFSIYFQYLVRKCYENSRDHGFWEGTHDNDYEKIALMHSELSEALELLRAGAAPKDAWYEEWTKKPEGVGAEMADVVIRIMDFCGRHEIDLHRWIVEKMEYNRGRPRMHGKEA